MQLEIGRFGKLLSRTSWRAISEGVKMRVWSQGGKTYSVRREEVISTGIITDWTTMDIEDY